MTPGADAPSAGQAARYRHKGLTGLVTLCGVIGPVVREIIYGENLDVEPPLPANCPACLEMSHCLRADQPIA